MSGTFLLGSAGQASEDELMAIVRGRKCSNPTAATVLMLLAPAHIDPLDIFCVYLMSHFLCTDVGRLAGRA
jgi:hypothetical protein